MYQGITKAEMERQGYILITTVKEGFEHYPYIILEGESNPMKYFLHTVLSENKDAAYGDFYYFRLMDQEQECFRESITEIERKTLLHFMSSEDQIYYPLNAENLDFLADITARNILFSSFYFGQKKAIIWGNYDLKYPLFCNNTETLEWYKKTAGECGLTIGGRDGTTD